MSYGPLMWFRHNYKVVVDMHGRARYECDSCRGRGSVGPWREAKDIQFAVDWANQDGSDHIDTGDYGI